MRTLLLGVLAFALGCGGGAEKTASSSSAAVTATTPIELADAWVAGFDGATSTRGKNAYDNTDTPGYPDGYYTAWPGDPGWSHYGNQSDCSSFSNALLERAYGWLPATKSRRPHAQDYYWAIRSAKGFTPVTKVQDLRVGDVIALLYPSTSVNTGHLMWVDAPPRKFSGEPDEGLTQYVVTIIDATNGFHDGVHGPTTDADSRIRGMLANGAACTTDAQCSARYGANVLCNTWQLSSTAVCSYSGAGRGQMRLYVDSAGTIQGFTWSPNVGSTYYPRPKPLPAPGATFKGEDIVVGRYEG